MAKVMGHEGGETAPLPGVQNEPNAASPRRKRRPNKRFCRSARTRWRHDTWRAVTALLFDPG